MNQNIDFVITWVDSNNLNWLKNFNKFSSIENTKDYNSQFRNWELLKYWFRGVEKFAPWVNKIFFITDGSMPEWLTSNSNNLVIIKHSDFIPDEFLPTFNIGNIEMFLHKIPGLSEQFVYFNDDFYLINHVKKSRFFINNLPCDISAFNVYNGLANSISNILVIGMINRTHNKKQILKSNFFKFVSFHNTIHLLRTLILSFWPNFTGFYDHHLPQAFLKSTFENVWLKYNLEINESLKYRFRNKISLTQSLFRYLQLVTSKFNCRNILNKTIFISLNNKNYKEAIKIIEKKSKCIIVLNDTEDIDFENIKTELKDSFSKVFPYKSKYEL
jgi:hypothetical protein